MKYLLEGFPETRDKAKIVRLKRLLEWLVGDAGFRRELQEKGLQSQHMEWLRMIGVPFSAAEVGFLTRLTDIRNIYLSDRLQDEKLQQLAAEYPLLALWREYSLRYAASMKDGKKSSLSPSCNGKLDAWRRRRLESIRSEVGAPDIRPFNLAIAFELSDGCSMGCWFCAFDPHPLEKSLDYRKERDFFTSVVREARELVINADASGTVLFYHATDPHDNHDYLSFLRDYEEISGSKTFTATAAGHDIGWVRSLLCYYRDDPGRDLRLSILSTSTLKKLHREFTPEELFNVDLLMQMRESALPMITAGRILEEKAGLRGINSGEDIPRVEVPRGTIACVNGFVVNMVRRTIRLVSPCYACSRWPKGYRVHGEAAFRDESDFGEVICRMIDDNMFLSPPPDRILRFRDDLVYRPKENGFDLVSPVQIHHFSTASKTIGDLIAAGDSSYETVHDALVKKEGMNPLLADMALQQLFEGGFLSE